MIARDRAGGWVHAKLSGHSNEERIKNRIGSDPVYAQSLQRRLMLTDPIVGASVGGLHEKNVPDVFGGSTKSKRDLQIFSKDGSTVNISIKKSAGGQVYLIGVERFLKGFTAQFCKEIPKPIIEGIRLFFGGSPEIEMILKSDALYKEVNPKIRDYEKSKRRLTWGTLKKFDVSLAESLISWFSEHTSDLAAFCFQRGLARDKEDWADIIWYKNEVGEYLKDSIFSIDEMLNALATKDAKNIVSEGTKNGGTTIQLPFGFVQWHQDKLQFHHQLSAIHNFCKPR
jgi:hypothetical protein